MGHVGAPVTHTSTPHDTRPQGLQVAAHGKRAGWDKIRRSRALVVHHTTQISQSQPPLTTKGSGDLGSVSSHKDPTHIGDAGCPWEWPPTHATPRDITLEGLPPPSPRDTQVVDFITKHKPCDVYGHTRQMAVLRLKIGYKQVCYALSSDHWCRTVHCPTECQKCSLIFDISQFSNLAVNLSILPRVKYLLNIFLQEWVTSFLHKEQYLHVSWWNPLKKIHGTHALCRAFVLWWR